MRRVFALAALGLLVAGACTQQTDTGGEGAQTRTVQVDGTPDDFAGFALAYFPDTVTVRPGDTVRFEQTWTGEPHSVTLGALVDEAIPEARALGPDEPSAELAEKLEALPVMLPEGPGDANQVAVNPCFLAQGPLPEDPTQPCEDTEQPEFDGTQAYYSSGFLEPDVDFEVTLAEDIEPGEYAFYCSLHGPPMSGTIEIIAPMSDIPSQDEVDAEAEAQIEALFASTVEAFEQAEAGDAPYDAVAGYGAPDAQATGIAEFIPDVIEIEAGEEVAWTIFGPHTISFNVPEDAAEFLVQAEDGTWHLNEKAGAPAGGPGQPPPPEGAEEPGEQEPAAEAQGPPEPTQIDGGEFDGEGFRSSGFFLSFPEPGAFFSYSLTFTEPGSYDYVCIIHPAMTGTVEVT